MTTEEIGERKLSVSETEKRQVQQLIDDYERGLRLPKNNILNGDVDVSKYINVDPAELSREECLENAVELYKISYYIQYAINVEVRIQNWAKARFDKFVLPQLSNFDKYTPKEEKIQLVVKESTYANDLQRIMNEAQMRIDTLSYLPAKIDNIAYALMRTKEVRHG